MPTDTSGQDLHRVSLFMSTTVFLESESRDDYIFLEQCDRIHFVICERSWHLGLMDAPALYRQRALVSPPSDAAW